jgi:hypothetical protein
VLTANEKYLEEKEKKDREQQKVSKIYTIVQGVAKNLCLSEVIKSLKIQYIELKPEVCEFLSEGIVSNKSLNTLIINNSQFINDSFETFAKCLLTHEAIEFLDFSWDSLDDKCGNMLGRIIIRQTQRRDQVIWMHGLRNEKPLNNDYTRGLISINLSNNQLSDTAAEEISNALSHDSYIRSIDLRNNQISEYGCKRFIKVLRKNLTVLNLNLRGNQGYILDNNIHKRLVIKLSKNIKHLHNQYIEGVFDKSEYEFMKKFVNYEFFNIEIPQHIIEMYSVENLDNKFESKDDFNSNKDKLNNRVKAKNLSNEQNSELDQKENQNDDNNYDYSDNQNPYCEEEEVLEENLDAEDNFIEEDSNIFNGYNTDSELDPHKSRANKKYLISLDKLKLQNRNLFHENLQLRKQILTIRAQLLQTNRGMPGCKDIIFNII